MNACRTESEAHGTCSTTRTCAPRSSGGPGIVGGGGGPASLRRSDEYAACPDGIGTTHRRGTSAGVVIPLVQTQVLLLARRRPGFRDDDGLQCALQQFRVMNIGARDHDPQWTAVRFDPHASLHPVFASIRRVLAHVIPPKRALPIAASADCHRQSTPPSSSQARVNFLQIFSSTPLRTHRWKYR